MKLIWLIAIVVTAITFYKEIKKDLSAYKNLEASQKRVLAAWKVK